MARPRKQAVEVSLFPFLSILACVIGILTLLIVFTVLSQINPAAVVEAEARVEEDEKRAKDFLALQEKLKAMQAEKNKAAQRIAGLKQPRNPAQLDAARKRLAAVQQAAAAVKPPDAEVDPTDLKTMKERLALLQPELTKRDEAIAKYKEELKRRKKTVVATVKVMPSGSAGRGKTIPTFVECAKNGLTVYSGPEPWHVTVPDITKNPKWIELLDQLAEKPAASVVFLIREDAISIYKRAKVVADTHYCRNGKLPVIGEGLINLDAFK